MRLSFSSPVWNRWTLVIGVALLAMALEQYLRGWPWWSIGISLGLGTLVLWSWWYARRRLSRRHWEEWRS